MQEYREIIDQMEEEMKQIHNSNIMNERLYIQS